MKKSLILCFALLLFITTGCASSDKANGSKTVTVNGFNGEISVTVTLKDGSISAVDVKGENESEEYGQKAIAELPTKIVEAKSANVDAITGATFTSEAIKTAVKGAIYELDPSNKEGDVDAWATINGYVKSADYNIVAGVDAISGASTKVDPAQQLTQEETRELALDYLRGWPLKTDENGNTIYSYREMYQIATSYNNVPALSSVEFVLDPVTMKLYASCEKGTEKCVQIQHNPNVVMYWYHQIPEAEYVPYKNDYFNSYGVQIKGQAYLMDASTDEAKHAAALYLETLYGAEAWAAKGDAQAVIIDKLLEVNDWICVDPDEYVVNSLYFSYNVENSPRPEWYDPNSPYFGKSVRQTYTVK